MIARGEIVNITNQLNNTTTGEERDEIARRVQRLFDFRFAGLMGENARARNEWFRKREGGCDEHVSPRVQSNASPVAFGRNTQNSQAKGPREDCRTQVQTHPDSGSDANVMAKLSLAEIKVHKIP